MSTDAVANLLSGGDLRRRKRGGQEWPPYNQKPIFRQIAKPVHGGLSCHARLPEFHPTKISFLALASRSIAFGKM
jgi:hypothetical protein